MNLKAIEKAMRNLKKSIINDSQGVQLSCYDELEYQIIMLLNKMNKVKK